MTTQWHSTDPQEDAALEVVRNQLGEIVQWRISEAAQVRELRAVSDQLASENAHMRAERAAKDQEAVVAFHTIKRLRAALTEMLESFTEPEDDNDILRRARAALQP